jgi:hypothetical protein
VIGNDIDLMLGSLEVMMPDFETFKDGKQFLVMHIIVALGVSEGMGVECDGVDFTVGGHHGDDTGKGIVGGVSFDKHRVVRRPVS